MTICDGEIQIAPGFIDLQVNGFAGADFNAPETTVDEIARAIGVIFSTGVTRFFPTIITGPHERMAGALSRLAEARESLENGPAMQAFHLEGPHISPEEGPRGAHPRQWVRPPDFEEFQRLQSAARGHVRLVTLSPDWPDAPRFIEKLVRSGVVVSIGHTAATAAQIRDAATAGATLSTHLGNAAFPTLPKIANLIWDQLADDRLTACFIADGIHLPGSFFRAAVRAKGIARSILVTDAVMPAMCAPGFYQLGEREVELKPDDRVVLRGVAGSIERLAGSSLRMDRAIANTMRIAEISSDDAIAMATANPARALGIQNPEDTVKLQVIAGTVTIVETYFNGRQVYSSAPA